MACCRRQPGDRRQHAEGVGGQEDDVARVARPCRGGTALGMILDRVGGAGVLGQRVVVEVELARVRVQHHVLEHGAEQRVAS